MSREPFDKMQTDSLGLWWNEDYHSWTSPALNLAKLREFKGNVRIIVKRNRFYKKGSGRPYFTVRIVSSKAETGKDPGCMSVCDDCEYYGNHYSASDVYSAAEMVSDGYSIDDIYAEY